MIMILLDFIGFIMSTLCSLLYVVYDMLLLGGIFILFPFESYDSKINLHKICLNKCNNCCTDICYNISWKSCEIITVAHYYYKTTILPKVYAAPFPSILTLKCAIFAKRVLYYRSTL